MRAFSILIIVVFIQSCALLNTDEATVPGYLYVPSFRYITDTASKSDGLYEGDNTDKIVDVWIAANGISLGTIGFPALLPVTEVGDSVTISIDAGVLKTGQGGERIPYRILSQFRKNVLFKPGVVDTVIPEFRYLENRKFGFLEDFDRTGMRLIINDLYKSPGDTIIAISDQRARKPGFKSGMLVFDRNSQRFQVRTELISGIPGQNTPVFLELDYSSNMLLDVGYYYFEPGQAASAAQSVVQLFPTGTWNKVYVALNQELVGKKTGTQYIFYIGVYNGDGSIPQVFLDNIKLVYLD